MPASLFIVGVLGYHLSHFFLSNDNSSLPPPPLSPKLHLSIYNLHALCVLPSYLLTASAAALSTLSCGARIIRSRPVCQVRAGKSLVNRLIFSHLAPMRFSIINAPSLLLQMWFSFYQWSLMCLALVGVVSSIQRNSSQRSNSLTFHLPDACSTLHPTHLDLLAISALLRQDGPRCGSRSRDGSSCDDGMQYMPVE